MPKRDVTIAVVNGRPRAALFVTNVSHLPVGQVREAPGTVGPLLQYGVLSAVEIVSRGIVAELAEPHSWPDHGPRIRDAVRIAVDLDGWIIES